MSNEARKASVAYPITRDGVSNIFAQSLDGGAPKQLTDFKADRIFSFNFSRDGKQIALSRGTVNNDVVLIKDFRWGSSPFNQNTTLTPQDSLTHRRLSDVSSVFG